MEISKGNRAALTLRWRQLVHAVDGYSEHFATMHMADIDGGKKFYNGLVDSSELREASLTAFRVLVDDLRARSKAGAGGIANVAQTSFARDIGIRRARQGVDIDKLTAAVQHDFAALWSCLLAVADTQDALVLALHADEVWASVDAFAGTIQSAYLEERVRITRQESVERQAVVSQLVKGDKLSPAFLAQASQILSIGDADYVWVASAVPGCEQQLRGFLDGLLRAGRVAYESELSGQLVVLWLTSDPTSPALVGLPRGWSMSQDATALKDVTCGIAPLHKGLRMIPRAVRVALEVSNCSPSSDKGPTTSADAWARVAAAQLEDSLPGFLNTYSEAILACRPAERDVLLSTVRSYADSGDVNRSAHALYCHRNTVMKRIRRFRELTTLDITAPSDAAIALLAISAVENRLSTEQVDG
jgi:hypothetical protein